MLIAGGDRALGATIRRFFPALLPALASFTLRWLKRLKPHDYEN